MHAQNIIVCLHVLKVIVGFAKDSERCISLMLKTLSPLKIIVCLDPVS